MIIVDSSVWIDYFNGQSTIQTDRLRSLLGIEFVAIGDVILTEVLQGFRKDADFTQARTRLLSLSIFGMLGVDHALRSAECYRELRRRGVTIRKTTDVIIASYCLTEGHTLLFSDKDFLPFVEYFGLCSAT